MTTPKPDEISAGAEASGAAYYAAASGRAGVARGAFVRSSGEEGQGFSLTSREQNTAGLRAPATNGQGVSGATVVGATARAEFDKKEKLRKEALERAFQSLIDRINQDIAAMDLRIRELGQQIKAVDALIELEKIDKLDPNNPDHRKLLIAAGIPTDKWGTITLEDLRRRRLELEEEMKLAREERQELSDAYESTRSAQSSGRERINLDLPSLKIVNAQYRKTHPDYDPKNATVEQAEDIRKLVIERIIFQRLAVQDKGVAWFRDGLAQLEAFKGGADYTQKLDQLVERLDDPTKWKLLDDKNLDPIVAERIEISNFRKIYANIQGMDKGSAEYAEMLAESIDMMGERARRALLAEPGTPQDVRTAIERTLPTAGDGGLMAPGKPAAV
jgi:hypothetical protein